MEGQVIPKVLVDIKDIQPTLNKYLDEKMQGSTMAIGVGDVKPVFDNNQLDKPNIEKNMEKNNEKSRIVGK